MSWEEGPSQNSTMLTPGSGLSAYRTERHVLPNHPVYSLLLQQPVQTHTTAFSRGPSEESAIYQVPSA